MDKYKIIQKLGSGAQGSVFKAIRKSDNKIVALKVIKINSNSKLYKFAENEIKLLEKIAGPNCHPNLACYYGHTYDKGKDEIIIEMEFIEGETLYKFAKKYLGLPLGDYLLHKYLLLIVKDVIKGLDYIHKNNILHNDIKPENIMIDRNFVPKLIDFGLACNTEICRIDDSVYKCCEGFSGTPDFASPEMYTTGIRYPASDIWSLGVTLYQMATGDFPFNYGRRADLNKIANAIVNTEPKVLKTNNTLLNEIVNRSLNKDVTERITGEEISKLLKEYK